jgi:hypothetical protein
MMTKEVASASGQVVKEYSVPLVNDPDNDSLDRLVESIWLR